LIGWGELEIASGLTAILMAMMPFIVVIIAHFLVPDEPLTPGKVVGVALGIAGILLLIGPLALSGLGGNLLSELAILAAALCYALSVLAARGLPRLGAGVAVTAMLLIASPFALVAAAVFSPPIAPEPSLESLSAAFVLGLFCSGFGYVLFLRVLNSAGAGFA